MKKLILVLLCLPMIGFGQQYGIKIGFGASQLSGELFQPITENYSNGGVLQGNYDNDSYTFSIEDDNSRERLGFSFGGFYEFNLKKLDLEAEIKYYRKGYEYRYSLSDNEYGTITPLGSWITAQTNYLNLSLNGKFNLQKSNRWFVKAGPYLGLLISDNVNDILANTEDYNEDGFATSNEAAEYFKNFLNTNYLDNYKKIDVGLNLGLGYNLKEVFLIEVIYGYGFSKVHNAWAEHSKMDNQTSSNRSLQLSLGYVIGSKQ